eukprot:tig00000857_g4940.t1
MCLRRPPPPDRHACRSHSSGWRTGSPDLDIDGFRRWSSRRIALVHASPVPAPSGGFSAGGANQWHPPHTASASVDAGTAASSSSAEALGPIGVGQEVPEWPPKTDEKGRPPTRWVRFLHGLGLDPRPCDENQSFTEEDARDLRLGAKFLVAYLWPTDDPATRARVVLACVALVASNALNASAPLIFKRIAERAGSAHAAVPIALVSALFAARSGSALSSACRYVWMTAVGQRAIRQVSTDLFGHMHALDARFHVERSTGAVVRVVDRGARAIERLISIGVSQFGRSAVEIAIIMAILLRNYGWRYVAASAGWLALYAAWTVTVTRWRTPLRKVANELDDRTSARLVDSLLNYETVKYFGQERSEIAEYDALFRVLERSSVLGIRSVNLLNLGQAICCSAALCCVLAMACRARVSVGDLVAVNGLTLQLYSPLEHLGYAFRELKTSTTDLRRLVELADTRATVQDAEDAEELELCGGAVEFRDVTFGYGAGRNELQNVSFRVEPGRTLAIVGPTGSGKSTVLRLLFRAYDPHSGSVLVDGRDVRDVTQESLRRHIGVVPQDTVLFNDSLYRNVRFGRPSASPEEVLEASRAARLDETVQRFPLKYATRVGERGVRLSGGEKQRVAIARVILKDPRILLLDEATSALDSATERDVLSSLRDLSRNRTAVVVAHRLSTVVDADAILVLDRGRVVEEGTHEELLARPGGRYAAMWRAQLKGEAAGRLQPQGGDEAPLAVAELEA